MRKAVIAAVVVAGWAAPASAQDWIGINNIDDPSYISVHAGAFGWRKEETLTTEFLVQYRPDVELFILKPHAGVMVTTDGAFYGFAGFLMDINIGQHLVLTPSTAIGYFYEGDGVDLGHAAEFRSGLEVAYRFDNGSRLGIGAYHMSNLVFGERNPGAESVTVTYSMPMNWVLP